MNDDNDDDRERVQYVERRKYQTPHDPRVTAVLSVIGIIMAALVTAAVISLFNLNTSVAVLLARPAGVPREEYARDTLRRDDDSASLKLQIADLRTSVEKIREDALQSKQHK